MCTSFLDGLNGNAAHISRRINLAVVAKSPIARVQEWADQRGWNHLRMLSAEGNSYNRDYLAETPEGAQLPMCNVFVDSGDGIRHYWASELFFVPFAGGASPTRRLALAALERFGSDTGRAELRLVSATELLRIPFLFTRLHFPLE